MLGPARKNRDRGVVECSHIAALSFWQMAAEASWNPFNVYQRWKEHKAMEVEQGKLDPTSPKTVAPLPRTTPSTPR